MAVDISAPVDGEVRLHDSMIQALYAIGLRLEYCIEVLDLSPEQVKVALNDVVERLDQLIEVLRGRIYELD